jgi:hypothetical protein
MTTNLNLTKPKISILKFIETGEYCQKIANILQNIKNSTLMEPENVKDGVIA